MRYLLLVTMIGFWLPCYSSFNSDEVQTKVFKPKSEDCGCKKKKKH